MYAVVTGSGVADKVPLHSTTIATKSLRQFWVVGMCKYAECPLR